MEPLISPASTSADAAAPLIQIYYEHPRWFDRLFAELDRRGTPYAKLLADEHWFATDVGDLKKPPPLLFNRMSPSAGRRERGHEIFYTLQYLSHLQATGQRVVNGVQAFRHEISKSLQLTLLRSLRLPYPRTRIIHRAADAPRAADGLRYPVVVKPNIGGSGAGVVRLDTPAALAAAAQEGRLDLGLDHTALVQEFIPARGGYITRVEVVGGKFLYAIRVHLSGETFDLCPADICRSAGGDLLPGACPVTIDTSAAASSAHGKAALRVEVYEPPVHLRSEVEHILASAGIEVGGIEYIVDDRDSQLYYYDINALSNFVADATHVIGFDPFVPLVDFLQREARDVR